MGKVKKRERNYTDEFNLKNMYLQFQLIDTNIKKIRYIIFGAIFFICGLLGMIFFLRKSINSSKIDLSEFLVIYMCMVLMVFGFYFFCIVCKNKVIEEFRSSKGYDPLFWEINKIYTAILLIFSTPIILLIYFVKKIFIKGSVVEIIDFLIPITVSIFLVLLIMYTSIVYGYDMLLNLYPIWIKSNVKTVIYMTVIIWDIVTYYVIKIGISVWFMKVQVHTEGNINYEKKLKLILSEMKYIEIIFLLIGTLVIQLNTSTNEGLKIFKEAYIFTSSCIAWLLTLQAIKENEIDGCRR